MFATRSGFDVGKRKAATNEATPSVHAYARKSTSESGAAESSGEREQGSRPWREGVVPTNLFGRGPGDACLIYALVHAMPAALEARGRSKATILLMRLRLARLRAKILPKTFAGFSVMIINR